MKWLGSYLINRKHSVVINGQESNELVAHFGVPQGSVLGPLLFLVYINDLFQLPLSCKVMGFADDTSLLYSSDKKEEILEHLENDQKILLPWFRQNLLHLNFEKCKFIVYAYKTPPWAKTIEIRTDHGTFQREEVIKYLGLNIDQKLTWKYHSLILQEKLRKLNYLFWHFKRYFNMQHLRNLYTPLYESVLNYGIIHWGASAHVKPVKVLQNKVCRNILGLGYRTSEAEIYTKMQKENLEKLYRKRLLIFLFKNKTSFELHNTKLSTRTGGTQRATYPSWRKTHSRMQARYQGYIVFNSLPASVRDEKKLSVFKRAIA